MMTGWQLAEELSMSLYRRLIKLAVPAITETTVALTADICILLPYVVTLSRSMPAIRWIPPSMRPLIQCAVRSLSILKPTAVSSSVFWSHGVIMALLKDI